MADDREFAGRKLGEMLKQFVSEDPLVIGIARSGVPVALGVSSVLRRPAHVVAVRKLELPSDSPSTIGALAEDGSLVLDDLRVAKPRLLRLIARATQRCKALVGRYRGSASIPDLRGRTVILVDDAFSTGATARAAIRLLFRAGAAKLVVAVPFALAPAAERVRSEANAIVALEIATPNAPVRCRYASFERLSDDELISALRRACKRPGARVE